MSFAAAGRQLLYPFTPYCGAPPAPGELLQRWNLDPALLTILALCLLAYAACSEPRLGGRAEGWRRACFYAGWAIGTVAVISPLCPLSVSLFSARVGQHMLLTTVVAPLVVLGQPAARLADGVARLRGRALESHAKVRPPQPLLAAAGFAVALWAWHAPGPYTATFHGDVIYWLMHISLFGTALWLWSALLADPGERLGSFVAGAALTTIQMGLLGAILTFAGRPLYPPHQFTTLAWGLTPLADQQLGGVVMWVPAGLILVAALVVAFIQAMQRAERRTLRHSPA